MKEPLPLSILNTIPADNFVALLGGVFEDAPWVAEKAAAGRPYSSVGVLHDAMVAAVRQADPALQDALIAAHPDLAGKAARAGTLTEASTHEQAGAGLDRLTDAEYERFDRANSAYLQKFGFPFIIAVKGHDKHSILNAFDQRLKHDFKTEKQTALTEIARIARHRLAALVEDEMTPVGG